MNKQSNTYIITYAIILVVIVAAVLSFAAMQLKPIQQRNVEIEKKSDVLKSVGLFNIDEKGDKTAQINAEYQKYIIESFLVNSKGDVVSQDPKEAFAALINIQAIYNLPLQERTMPVFVSKNNENHLNYIFPVQGTGLWGPIWGFVALSEDLNTISGVVFGHQSETPGLGAEIATPIFQDQFAGKHLFKDHLFVGISVLKGVGSSKGNDNAVDAISGGTITSVAVQDMLQESLGECYRAYIENMVSKLNKEAQTLQAPVVDSVAVVDNLQK